MSDELVELPEGWKWSHLSEIVSPDHPLCYGVVQPGEEAEQGAYLIRVCDLGGGTVQLENLRKISQEIDQQYKRSKVHGGELLVSLVGTIGRVAIVPNEIKEANIARAIARVHPVDDVSAYWLAYWLQADDMQDWLNREAREVARKTLNLNTLETTRIPIAPLNEQKRIVAAIESLRERSQKARSALSTIPDLCDKFRQSVLAAAFRGDLTADWREQNPDVEPASVLLERIRRKRFELADSRRDVLSTQKAYDDEANNLPIKSKSLPVTWIKCTINSIGNVCNGSTPSRQEAEYWNGSIPWVSSGEVCNNQIYTTRERITKEGYKNSSVRLLPQGTVLIAMIGEGKTRGQTAILRLDATINQNIAGVILNHGLVLSEYLWYWFQYQYASTREAGSGSGPQALNCQRVREIPFVLPPLLEQKEIIDCIENTLQKIFLLKQTYQNIASNLNLLDRSILAKAFRGELVEQDPNDEPASVLLEHIRAEREQQTQGKAKKPGKKGQRTIKAE